MTYELEFDPRALKEWKKLDASIRVQFKAKLEKILENPKLEVNRLHGLPNCYKIKLRNIGYRLVYQVQDKRLIVFVVAVGKRERKVVYKKATQRIE